MCDIEDREEVSFAQPNAETQLLTDKNESSERNNRDGKSSDDSKDGTRPVQTSTGCTLEFDYVDWKVGKNDVQDVGSDGADSSGEVNMEASITPDDVTRAGGFGARDDMSSFLPVASDFTDFEESILDARDYEEPQGKVCRPGLGWAEAGGSKRE